MNYVVGYVIYYPDEKPCIDVLLDCITGLHTIAGYLSSKQKAQQYMQKIIHLSMDCSMKIKRVRIPTFYFELEAGEE